jgi:hypothetical protein
VGLGGFGPFVPKPGLHEALQSLHYTRWQFLLETVCFVVHGFAQNVRLAISRLCAAFEAFAPFYTVSG